MTPQEKADSLVAKYDKLLPIEGTTTAQTPVDCAIICVEEIIKAQPCIDFWDSSTGPELRLNTGYWNKVLSILKSKQ